MARLSSRLEEVNATIAAKVSSGELRGPNLDAQIVNIEQTAVQRALDSLQKIDSALNTKMVGEINSLLNPRGGASLGSRVLATDRAYGRILGGVRKDLGRDIDFARQSDREAIGNAVIDHIRRTGGCDVTGTRIKAC